MKIVFIAGPYFGDGTYEQRERNIQEAEEYAIALANRGIAFFCYATHTRHFEVKANAPEPFYKALDAELLKRACDAVLATPRWQESSGARNDVRLGREREMPIFFPESLDDLDEVEKWANE